MIRVAIVDDDALVRAGLRVILSSADDIEVVSEADDGAGVPDLVRRDRPDVVVMDIRMPRVDGIEATRRLVSESGPAGADPAGTGTRVLVLTTFENDAHVLDALLAGARGFVLKRATPAELLTAIRAVARTDSLVFPEAIRRVAGLRGADTPAWAGRLTSREREVLAQVCRGRTNAEIAAELVVSLETVKSHLSSLLTKSGSRHRTELAVRAYQGGLVE